MMVVDAIGFKLIQALGLKQGQTVEDLSYLDRCPTIAADIVPMTGENRVLAYFGLQVINSNPRPGIKALVHQVKKPLRYYRRFLSQNCGTH
jgi:single-stranded-DNA-specific exonuclease